MKEWPESLTRVVLFQTREPSSKITHLVETATLHFEKKEHFLIVLEDDQALQYVDEMLWKTPSSSFLPHVITDAPTSELIVLTRVKKNLNQARFVFNLCPTP